MTWNDPVAVVSDIYEGEDVIFREQPPDLAIDTFRQLPDGQTNENYGDIYVVWTDRYPPGHFPGDPEATGDGNIFIAVSGDGGLTWTTQLEQREKWEDLNGDGVRQDDEVMTFDTTVLESYPIFARSPLGLRLSASTPRVTIGPEGDVYVGHRGFLDFSVEHSTNGAASFAHADEFHETPHRLAFGPGSDTEAPFSLSNNRFETPPQREIAADPTRPGHVYAATTILIFGDAGEIIDGADVFFARSTDYGETWERSFMVGSTPTDILNDENDGRSATGLAEDEVIAGQAFIRLAVDEQGTIALFWADQRRDPAEKRLDLFGTVSTDGGQTFSPNFRITDFSFDAEQGSFIDPQGMESFYFGQHVAGLDLVNNMAYVAWTDTRPGDKDIYFARYPLDPSPAALNDRFEPNDTPDLTGTPTMLGRVVTRVIPKLEMLPGDEDWFLLEAAAAGNVDVSALQSELGDHLRLELWNKDATTLLASGANLFNGGGQVTGKRVVSPSKAGQEFLLRVLSESGGAATRYSLDLKAITEDIAEDIGPQVHGIRSRAMEPGDEFFYLLATGAPGALDVRLTAGGGVQGNLNIELLDANDFSVLADGEAVATVGAGQVEHVSAPVEKNQALLIRVFGDAGSEGDFTLEFTNFDQFTTAGNPARRFAAGPGPSHLAMADLNGDQKLDLVVSNALVDTISVLLGNGDGTLQAPRQFPVGAFTPIAPNFPTLFRIVAIADFNRDDIPDVVVKNFASPDVSVLLGRGDGSFEPQLRFDVVAAPFSLDTGDLNGDGTPDLVVTDISLGNGVINIAVLLARGDGTFEPQRNFAVDSFGASDVQIADFNNDGNADLAIATELPRPSKFRVLFGNGDGDFTPGNDAFETATNHTLWEVADLNSDGNLDIMIGGLALNNVHVHLGNGDGTFTDLLNPATGEPGFSSGQPIVDVAVADLGSEVTLGDSSTTLGPPDGRPDLIVANIGDIFGVQGLRESPEVVVLPGQFDDNGDLIGFGAPQQLAPAKLPTALDVGDLNNDGVVDVAAADQDAVLVIYGEQLNIPPNNTPETARNLGTVVHLVEQTLTIIPGHEDAFFKLTAPTERVNGAGDQVIDFSALFEATSGAGLSMEVLDSQGNVLGAGERFRVRAAQGQELILHVFGVEAGDGTRGSGAYTLAINVLPQLVSLESQALLPGQGSNPGGSTASIVVSLQGDRLDPATTQEAGNYTVTFFGGDGVADTGDDMLIAVDQAVYNPSRNIEVSSGTRHPTAIKQTINLLFDDPLPPGSYRVELSDDIQTAPFNEQELDLLANRAQFDGHPVVQQNNGQILPGSSVEAVDLVLAAGALSDFTEYLDGTAFLSQLHDDLAAILDSLLTERDVNPDLTEEAITQELLDEVLARFVPALGEVGARPASMLVLVVDPAGIDLDDDEGNEVNYDITMNTLKNDHDDVYVDVTGIVQIIVLPNPTGTYDLTFSHLPEIPRAGVVILGENEDIVMNLTTDLKTMDTFSFDVP